MNKPSFFARLTGSAGEYDNSFNATAGEHAVFEGEGNERHARITARDDSFAPAEP